MERVTSFDLNEALKRYLDDPAKIECLEADSRLVDCENDPELLTSALINSAINPIIDAIAENPDAVTNLAFFDSIQFLLKSTSCLPVNALSKLFDLIVSGLSSAADIIHAEFEAEESDSAQSHKNLLEIYAFLLQWAIAGVETKFLEKPGTAVPRARSKGGKKANKEDSWDSTSQILVAFEIMSKVLKLKLSKIFVTTSERDVFVGLFTRSAYLVLENEQRVKSTPIRMHAYKVLCIAIKHHGHGFGAQTSILQNLSYFEHLSEPMAELLHILSEQYDYPQLTDEVLRELSQKEFHSNDNKGPKSVSAFIVKLSELAPRLVIKEMTLLIKQLDSESYALRCALIEVCGNLIADLSRQEERNDNHQSQLNAFFDVLEERFLDVNPYCRMRVLQVYVKICDLESKFPKRRQRAAELAARSLEDKSSNVRKNAIKLLGRLVATHPFSVMHGGLLSYKEWNDRLEAVDAELNALKPPAGTPGLAEHRANDTAVDDELLDEATVIENTQPKSAEEKVAALQAAAEEAATSEAIGKLQLTRRYYVEAIRFIEVLHEGSETVCQLLSSKNKSETTEAMDFFVIIDAYRIETARVGIRRMLRLIWTKGNSDEGQSVQAHLLACYKGLFFDAPDNFSANDAANYVARNMISLTFGATSAELTSLEQLLSTMMKNGQVSPLVIQKLWQIYGVQKKEISKTQRRGAIIVLGMLALADSEIVVREMETMLRIGLGPFGRADLALARHTCIALRRISQTGRKNAASKSSKLPNDHAVIVKLASFTEMTSDSMDWFPLAEQSISAIYSLAKHPDVICSEVLRRKTTMVFAPSESSRRNSVSGLTQLLFIVGHVAIKQIVHLELCELDFKRRKAEKEKSGSENKSAKKDKEEADELDMIGGTTEDDFTEAMAHIRERELLYGKNSLLANFGPLVTEVCANNTAYADQNLQATAAICMAKLMCVSSAYCETNLPLLITVLERSSDPVTRSNLVIALGDMAVCFNHLIDENTDFLYRRLNDTDISVKRTCLMTLTFLILAGQVKVKGQLGEMAKCLESTDKSIADLSRMFFTELATKDNAVYNHFVDMFSLLAADESLDDTSMRRIIKFLASFIEKDKHAKQLAEKLASRLARCESERQWDDVAYALSLLPHKNEEIQKTVAAGFRVVQVQS